MSKSLPKEISKNKLLDNIIKLYLDSKNKLNNNENPELEVKFGTKGIKIISKINFDSVIQQLLSNDFKFKQESVYYLRINTKNIRTEIIGLKNIQEYCKINKLPKEINSDAYKFIEKNLYKKNESDTKEEAYNYSQVDYSEFNFKVTYNVETFLDKNNPIIIDLIKNWENLPKFFRLINRFTMIHSEYPLLIDLSIVRESKYDSSNKNKNNLNSTNIFNEKLKYEIEIEIDNEKFDNISNDLKTPEIIDKLLKKNIKFILSGLQKTNFPISYSEQDIILNQYMKLISKGNTKENYKILPKDFIGPSSSTLQINNIAPKNNDSKIINIRKEYTVTEKADGERKMLYISQKGLIYLITTSMNIQFTGAQTSNTKIYNSLLDGEHILRNKKGQFINLYAAFDIYFINEKDVRKLQFIPSNTEFISTNFRIPLLKMLIENLKPNLFNTDKLAPIRIEIKIFYEVNPNQTIFAGCNTIQQKINDGFFEYETDGLIFTPMNLGVGLEKQDEEPKSSKTTWPNSFKWKPVEFNTIDFLITIKKEPTGADYIGNIFRSGLNTSTLNQITQYKTVILRVGYDQRKHGYLNPCENIINDEIPSFDDIDEINSYKPVQFFPTNPYNPNAGITNIPLQLDNTNNSQMFTEENEVIEDNTIIEFKFDKDREENWKWIPLRVRYDKTAEYRQGYKNYGNAYHVAQSNWHSIHNPITIEMITTGKNIPDELATDDIYYNKTEGNNYTKAMRDFHNLFVKLTLIKSVSNNGDILIDYAVGKGGDISKWIAAKLDFVFGLDLSRDNIENKLDGACARYLNYRKKFKIMPNALFIQGSADKNIKNLSSQFTEKAKTITKAIFGEGPKDQKILGKGVAKSYGVASEGFNVSSIQFAIHYMFQDSNTLNSFLTNVAECTKLGGYFIGTSYDGKKIFDLLKNKKQNDTIIISDNEKNKLLEITKMYDKNEFLNNISCLGYTINVFQDSINKTFKEYLVNYDYLTTVLENYGFVPLNVKELEEINFKNSIGNFSELYELMKNKLKSNPKLKNDFGMANKMSNEQKSISFLNNYFIFKKIRNVDIKDLEVTLSEKTEKDFKKEIKDTLIAQQQIKSVIEETKEEQPNPISKSKKKIKLKTIPSS